MDGGVEALFLKGGFGSELREDIVQCPAGVGGHQFLDGADLPFYVIVFYWCHCLVWFTSATLTSRR